MKKLIFIIILESIVLLALSCTKTCTCEDANNKIKEIEVNPSEQCSARSNDSLGVCS